MAGLLSACGGGGGGGDGTAGSGIGGGSAGGGAGGTGASTTLAFTTANAGRVAGHPLWASELMFRIGHAVSEEIAVATKQSGAMVTAVACASGTLNRSWTDKDGNGTLSAGDEITLDFGACAREPLARSAQGRIAVVLDSVTGSGDSSPASCCRRRAWCWPPWSARPARQTSASRARCALSFPATNCATRCSSAEAAMTPWHSTFQAPASPPTASPPSGSRRPTAGTRRAPSSTSTCTTTAPSSAAASTSACPRRCAAGWMSCPNPARSKVPSTCAGAAATWSASPSAAPAVARPISPTLDLAGDGSVDARGQGTWEGIGLVSGVFFADHTPGGRGNTYAYNADEFTLRAPFVGGSTLPVDTSFSLQFTRPVAGAAAWRWRLMEQGRLDQMPTAGVEVPVQVELHGALITLKATQPLRYSRRYELLVDTGEPTADGQRMRATTGGSLSRYGGSIGAFASPNILNPQSSLAGHLTLRTGATVEAVGLPPPDDAPADIRYQWTQLGGTLLTIDQPNERSTLIGLAPGASGVGSATVRLTVSVDGDRNSESADFVLRTVADTSGAWISRLRVPMNLEDWFNSPKELWSGPAVGTLTASRLGDRLSLAYAEAADPTHPNGNWSLELSSADGQELRPGTYANVYSSSWYLRPAGVPTLDLVSGRIQPSSVRGEFVIHELEVDGAGRITRLALDFTAPQGSGPVSSSGAIRINSARAMPP